MRWIVARVDKLDYDRILRAEEQAIAAVKSAERRKKTEELRKALVIDQDEIAKLAISNTSAAIDSK